MDIDSNQVENNLRIMETVEKELNKRKAESNFCFSIFLIVTSVWVLLVKLWEMLGKPIEDKSLTVGVEIIAVIMFLVTKYKTQMPMQELGLNKKKLKASMIRAAIISGAVSVIMVVLKLIMKPGEVLIDKDVIRVGAILNYCVTSVFQEFLARGFLLTCLLRIYDFEQKKHIAIIVSSLLFTTLHLYYGFVFMVGAGILSIILGYVYVKDENIWGVSLIHFMFGYMGTILALV